VPEGLFFCASAHFSDARALSSTAVSAWTVPRTRPPLGNGRTPPASRILQHLRYSGLMRHDRPCHPPHRAAIMPIPAASAWITRPIPGALHGDWAPRHVGCPGYHICATPERGLVRMRFVLLMAVRASATLAGSSSGYGIGTCAYHAEAIPFAAGLDTPGTVA